MTTDLSGRVVTDLIFADSNITVVNIWTTNSEPCIALQPKLWQLGKEVNEVKIITLIGNNDIEAAKKITVDCPSDFVNLIVNGDFENFLSTIHSAPTTIFVDNQLNIIGQAVIGDDIELIRQEINHLIEANSSDYKNQQSIQESLFR